MHATRTKLAEASFFLHKLDAVSGKVFCPEPEAFGFYLSAFVSAGRSVTFALQAEHKREYDEWFPSWCAGLTDEQRALLSHFNGLRNDAVKRLGVELSLKMVEIPMHEYLLAAARDGADIQIWHPPGTPAPPQHKMVRAFVIGGSERDVVEACRFYLELVLDAIASFTSAYPAAA
jgi:hypothetical protein